MLNGKCLIPPGHVAKAREVVPQLLLVPLAVGTTASGLRPWGSQPLGLTRATESGAPPREHTAPRPLLRRHSPASPAPPGPGLTRR